MKTIIRIAFGVGFGALAGCHDSGSSGTSNTMLATGDEPVIGVHVRQTDAESGAISTDELIDAGRALFVAQFNTLDGAGRPEATGTGAARPRREAPENMNRISAPDTDSCAGCHNKPGPGGGGDNVANVFVLAQALPHVNFDGEAGDDFQAHTLSDVANERATIGMYGSGYVELLAREITTVLHTKRDMAKTQAAQSGHAVTVQLLAKGISFGSLTANPDGSLDTSAVDGVDADLVIKPFHQKGVVTSLREFSNNAMNHHHGMQTSERFGAGVDQDKDGHVDELTVGDVTAVTLFQATMPAPGRKLPDDPNALAAVQRGETQFTALGCATCHVPTLQLDDPVFTEPNPFNPTGNLQVGDVTTPVAVDLTTAGPGPHLRRDGNGHVQVPVFTDFKRHDMGPDLAEPLVQAGVPGNLFLTKKLWGFFNEPPFMHHGRALTIGEAILMHGGEGAAARDAFANLAAGDQDDLIAFLKTLQILPDGTPSTEILAPFDGTLGDAPAMTTHVDQTDVDNGVYSAAALAQIGERVFVADFNTLDGACRPETTGTGAPRTREVGGHNFNRISGPDSQSCAACHNLPRAGGGGESVANVWVLAQRLPFVNFDGGAGDGGQAQTLQTVGNERTTIGMFGAGYIELLAREMSTELQAQRQAAITTATTANRTVVVDLVAKGVAFGRLTVQPNGNVDPSAVDGVDADLVVKPFHQKGVVTSLREFSNNAMNHHHGMQPAERFGAGLDQDVDGLTNELTVGDITAVTLFQALLPAPGRVLPEDARRRAAVDEGERLFASVGCATCHVPTLQLDDPVFTEPNPFNPTGNLQVGEVPQPFAVDLTAAGEGPRLPRGTDGKVAVPAYTDLKRHDMGPDLAEPLVQAGVPGNLFLTKKLWGFANEPPYMHHGRAKTIDEAIRMHGGEGATSRDAYAALSDTERRAIVDFLKTMQVVDAGAPLETTR